MAFCLFSSSLCLFSSSCLLNSSGSGGGFSFFLAPPNKSPEEPPTPPPAPNLGAGATGSNVTYVLGTSPLSPKREMGLHIYHSGSVSSKICNVSPSETDKSSAD
eukprot:Lithocolla_globosa_v1_NODE_3943_length_1546_cov_7.751174.p3 type:complete len:104 gc:universal NODE_3943_length_1546_cov_7.751174:576-265(-)